MARSNPIIAYIPAKGRSRGLPNKNLALLAGKPLVEHTIEFACTAHLFDAIYLSTDSPEIRAIGQAHQVRVLDRPVDLASDTARVADVLAHDLKAIKEDIPDLALIACLIPTSPLRRLQDLNAAIDLLDAHPDAPSVVSLSLLPFPLAQIMSMNDKTKTISAPFGLEGITTQSQRQSHPTFHYPNGAIVVIRTASFEQSQAFYFENASVGLPLDPISSIDIDSSADLARAEFELRSRNFGHGKDL